MIEVAQDGTAASPIVVCNKAEQPVSLALAVDAFTAIGSDGKVYELNSEIKLSGDHDKDKPIVESTAPQGLHWSSTAVVDLDPVNQYPYGNIRRYITDENPNRVEYLHGCAVNLVPGQARDDVLKRTPPAGEAGSIAGLTRFERAAGPPRQRPAQWPRREPEKAPAPRFDPSRNGFHANALTSASSRTLNA